MDRLNLPGFDIKLKREERNTLVFDQIRKKYVVLTPEEWVRQHFINYLISDLEFPRSLINVEQGLRYNRLLKRSDILVYNREGKPVVLVECKSARVNLNQKVVEQAACLLIDQEAARVEFLPNIPLFGEL